MSSSLPIGPAARIAGPYTASAGQTSFSFAFALLDAGDLAVETAAAATPDVWLEADPGTDYTVSGTLPLIEGGNIVFASGRTAGTRVRILGRAVIANTQDPLPAGRIDSGLLNRFFDRMTIWAQELRRDLNDAALRIGLIDGTTAVEASQVAVSAAGAAVDSAETAANQASLAATEKAGATAARVLAETARDASFANAKGDTTIALARARVADGETFVVFAADALTYDAYRRESSSTETYLGSFPSADYVGEIDARIRPEQVLSSDDFAFAIRDPDTGQSPFAILADERGTIRNRHLAGIEENATEAMNGRVRLEPTGQALSWGVVQPKANGDEAVVLGVRSTDGRIINPSFGALWNAVFGGAVATGDLAEADTIIMHGPRIYAVEGRAIDLFAASLLPNRNSGSGRVFALQSVKADGQPLHALWRDQARIRCDDLGTTARLKIINDGIAGAEFSKSITVVKSASSKTASPRVALIGDSITNGAHLITEDRFDGYSVNPYFMGTRRPTTGRDSWAEGRGGWGATDYCYDRTTYIPLPAGQEAAALAAQTDNRNPFIRASTGGDDPSFVRNGYIFDYRYYLDRFGMADPDIVVINLGTNDIAQIGLPSALTRARDCIDIMIAQIRGACPSAIIGLALAQKGNSITENPNWYQGYAQLWLHWHETYGASSDVHVLSTHAMASDRLNFDMTTTATNAQTGQTKQILADAIHPDAFIGYPSYAEGIFSFIHAMS